MTNAAIPTARPTRRRTITTMMVDGTTLADRVAALDDGWLADRAAVDSAYATFAAVRADHGFAMVRRPVLLTPPAANAKLIKGATPAYGLTIQSHLTTFADGSRANACPMAGHCVAHCVLNNGNGRYASVQRARNARSEFLARHPLAALTLIGFELRRASDKFGAITFRPNVNSDVDWHAVIGDTFRRLDGVTSYGYTKRDLAADALDFEALSWGERTTPAMLAAAAAIGRPIAAVTARRPADPTRSAELLAELADIVGPELAARYSVADAELTDEWMMAPTPTIGDLSAKGSARELIGRSGFVHGAAS